MVFQNQGGTYAAMAQSSPLTGVRQGTVALADYDLDGDLDLMVVGSDSSGNGSSKLYVNAGVGAFTDSGLTFVNVDTATATWADLDGDGDSDLVLSGTTTTRVLRLYRNTTVEGVKTLVDAATLTGVNSLARVPSAAYGQSAVVVQLSPPR